MTDYLAAELDVHSCADQLIKLAEHDGRPFVHLLDTDELLQFNNGKYAPVAKAEIAHQIEALEPTAKNQFINEVFDKIKRRSPTVHIKDFDRSPHILNVKNCLIDLKTGEVRAHDPEFLSFSQIDADWNPLARSRRFEKFLRRIIPEDRERLRFLDMWAACLWRKSIKKDVMLIGETDSAKSTILELVRRFLGPENVSSVSLQELDSDKYSKADLHGRLANIHADIDDAELKRTSGFKTTNGGDQVRAQRKFGHAFTFVPYAKRFFSCNKIPATKDESNAFFNRWIVIPFSQSFIDREALYRYLLPDGTLPENVHVKDSQAIEKLLDEEGKSAILNVLIDRALRVIESGGIPNAPSIEETRDAWLIHSDLINRFIDENLQESPEGRLPKAEVYQGYVKYCNDRRITPKSEQALNAKLKARGAVPVDGKPDGKHTVKQWKGIQWKPNSGTKLVEPVERGKGRPSTNSTKKSRHLALGGITDQALSASGDSLRWLEA